MKRRVLLANQPLFSQMKIHPLLVVALSCALVLGGCRKRKATPTPEIAPETPAEVAAPPPTAGSAAQAVPAPVNVTQVEAGVEFSDLNNVIASFEAFHKRMPTVADLQKSYYGGTRPIPIPPGYKLVIDQKSKKAKLVPGN